MEKLLSVKEAAEALRVSPHTVRSWLHKGRLMPVKLGRRTLLTERELERLVYEGTRQGGQK